MNIRLFFGSAAIACFSVAALAKLPPAPPPDPAAVAAKAEKDKAAAEKGKAQLAAAEERTVANFQANMKKVGKPIPKPTPIVVAAAPGAPVLPAGKTITAASPKPIAKALPAGAKK